ncbi:MAG: GNAT family N-acetyltransferase [Bacteroidia bacterium]
MSNILDNPIYYALNSGNRAFASGTEEIAYFQEDVAPFAGLVDYTQASFDLLYESSAPESTFVIFTPIALKIPNRWDLIGQIDMFQMLYEPSMQSPMVDYKFNNLNRVHVDEMVELIKLTQPGPFRTNTIALGNYTGIFKDEKLVSMAGQRLNPIPYVEISAVCTHPNHLGKGYAHSLLREQVRRILEKSQVPFLHVRNDNSAAVKLYQKLGFKIRTGMIASVLKKID